MSRRGGGRQRGGDGKTGSVGLGTGYNGTALRGPEPDLETTQAGHKPWPWVWTSHQHTIGHDRHRQTCTECARPWRGDARAQQQGVCVHACVHTHTHTHAHTSTHKPNRHPGERGEDGTRQVNQSSERTHTQHYAHVDPERRHMWGHPGMPRCAGEWGRTGPGKAGSGLRDRHPENHTHTHTHTTHLL